MTGSFPTCIAIILKLLRKKCSLTQEVFGAVGY
jgi:hypothetical protein